VGEEFQKLHPNVRVTVGISGTGGGFKKFCAGETDISDASRAIKDSKSTEYLGRKHDSCRVKEDMGAQQHS
jgi:phosphate transport system substrate-binding protein